MPGAPRKGIPKDYVWSKPLPELPPPTPPRLATSPGRINQFIPGNCPPASPSSKFHPRKNTPLAKMNNTKFKPCALYRVDSDVDERPWIRGGSSSAPSTRPASPAESKKASPVGLGILTSSGVSFPDITMPLDFEGDSTDDCGNSMDILQISSTQLLSAPKRVSRIPVPSPRPPKTPLVHTERSVQKYSTTQKAMSSRHPGHTKARPRLRSARMKGRRQTSASSTGFHSSKSRIPRFTGVFSLSRTSSTATSQSSSRMFQNLRRILHTNCRSSTKTSNIESWKPSAHSRQKSVQGLKLIDKRFSSSVLGNPTMPGTLRKATNIRTERNSLLNASPPFVLTSQSQLKRRQRVKKQDSISECGTIRHPADVDIHTSSSGCPIILYPDHMILHDSPRTSTCSSIRHASTFGQRTPRGDSGTVHSLPLILPANQDYKCQVEWESEESADCDEAEKLWRRLELECGMDTGHGLASPKRGRWKVRVIKTPTISEAMLDEGSTSESGFTLTDDGTSHTEDTEAIRIIGEENMFIGVLREVDDIIPSVNDFSKLAETLRKSPGRKRARPLKNSRSRKIVHSDLRRALGSVWEGCDQLETRDWSTRLALLGSRSMSNPTIGNSQPEWKNHKEKTLQTSPTRTFSAKLAEATVERSLTLRSGDSVIDLYFEP